MSGVELALAIVPLVIAVIQHRKPLVKVGRALLTSRRNDEQMNERLDFYSQLYIELSTLHNTLQRLTGDASSENNDALQQHVNQALGTGIHLFEIILRDILQSIDDLVSDKSLGLEGMNFERTLLARLQYINDAARNPESRQSLRERFRFTRNEKSQKVAMKRIRAGNDRLFMLVCSPMGLDQQGSRIAGRNSMTTRRLPPARSQKFLEPLYKRLARRWPKGCCNQFQHEARLSLSSCCNSQQRKSNERINLMVSLPGELGNQPSWQGMSMIASQEKSVRFEDGGEANPCPPSSSRRDVDSESICLLLHKAHNNGTDLRIILESEKFWHLQSELATWKIQSQMGTPLRSFLPNSSHGWRLRERSVLAVILAHAVLHFLESPWLCNNWSKDHLVFFRKESSADIDFDRPFLTIDFEEKDAESNQNDPFSVHPNPTILALGILLLEIFTQSTIESQRKAEHLSSGKPNANTDLTTAISVLEKEEGDLRVKYRHAVKECLNWNDVHLDSDDRRRRIYEKVVEPLERELAEGFPGDEYIFTVCEQYDTE